MGIYLLLYIVLLSKVGVWSMWGCLFLFLLIDSYLLIKI